MGAASAVALKTVAPLESSIQNEPDVESSVVTLLRSADFGYEIKFRKCGIREIDRNWPSKNAGGSKTSSSFGEPDLLLCIADAQKPVCVWENKARSVKAIVALEEAQFYVEGLHRNMPLEPALPRIAAGFNGAELLLSYFTNERTWIPLKANGSIIKDSFPVAEFLRNGISSEGVLTSISGAATVKDLREVLWRLKTLYRVIPPLAPGGRTPIEFTIATLTLRLMVEQHPDWGTWSEQPALHPGAPNEEQRIAETFSAIVNRILSDQDLRERYGSILVFKEKERTSDVSFNLSAILDEIPRDKVKKYFSRLFSIIDALPPLLHADFDIFGEVYQYIGDEATKKALGEFFTGRHIISGLLPVFFARAGWDSSFEIVAAKHIADIACGTGGFLTETLRLVKKIYKSADDELKHFAQNSFYGFDLGQTNASRARVNMYFAGDGFSEIKGGVDTLDSHFMSRIPGRGFDAILTNPPYGKSSYGRYEEAFLTRVVEALKPGEGWGLIVLPTGILENPRSDKSRFTLLKHARVTDVIALPKHAFAPYTQQRTAIVIFNKRRTPLAVADNDWDALLQTIGNEQIAMYIVDNDGYANSDKRYPTERKDATGKWLHNDLMEWVDSQGISHTSDLYNALIDRIAPPESYDEFGFPLQHKYGVLRVKDLFIEGKGGILLPDVFLRRPAEIIPFPEYMRRCEAILNFSTQVEADIPAKPLIEEIDGILALPVDYADNTYFVICELADIFHLQKGDTELTEEICYQFFDRNGLPVYGGGASGARFKISRNTRTGKNKPVTVFQGPAIIISLDGTSGSMRVLEDGEFCLNHHGCVLTPFDISLDLYWFVQQNEAPLKALASNQNSSATLTMQNLKIFKVKIPVPAAIRHDTGSRRHELVRLKRVLFARD